MKYTLRNRLSDFEFHDASLFLKSCENGNLSITAKYLNIHKDVPENPHSSDMEIERAALTFQNAAIVSFTQMRSYQWDDKGNLYAVTPQILYRGSKARKLLLSALEKGISVNCAALSQTQETPCLEVTTSDGFIAVIAFEEVVIQWDAYCGKAWYELPRPDSNDCT